MIDIVLALKDDIVVWLIQVKESLVINTSPLLLF
jgi:hypothetical protein